MTINFFTAVVLAAGKGTRMKTELPKVLVPFMDKPLIFHVLENLYKAGCRRCIIVLGYEHELVKKSIVEEKSLSFTNDQYEFVIQKEQLGTGHALVCAKEAVLDSTEYKSSTSFIVTAGDVPLLSANSFKELVSYHRDDRDAQGNSSIATVLSASIQEPYGYGRIIRDATIIGGIQKIVEERDATAQEKKIQEINTGTYVFVSPIVFPLLAKIVSANVQGEYYLPDIISIARREAQRVACFRLNDSDESRGVNSIAERDELERIFINRKTKAKFETKAKVHT